MSHYAVIGDNRPVVSYQSIRTVDGRVKLVARSHTGELVVPNSPEAEEHYFEYVEKHGLMPAINILVRLAQLGHACANRMADKLIEYYG